MEPVTERMINKWLVLGESPVLYPFLNGHLGSSYQLVHGKLMFISPFTDKITEAILDIKFILETRELQVEKQFS